MKRLLILLILLLAFPQPASAAPDSPPLCLPGVYTETPADCLLLGPAKTLSDLAALGITYPRQPLPAHPIDPALGQLPFAYARVRVQPARIFASAEAAAEGETVKRYLEAGLNYVTFIDYAAISGTEVYMLAPGEWIRRDEITLSVVPSPFAGLAFSGTPARPFGWVTQTVESQLTPGFNSGIPSGKTHYPREIIQVYSVQNMDGLDWYLIGPDEWIDERMVALVFPTYTPPEGVSGERWIEIDLAEQTIAVYDEGHLVFATLTSTGVYGFWTRPGLFQIYERTESTLMTGAFTADRSDFYYLEDVPYTLYFDERRAFHGTYWHNNFGYQMSHGCANLSAADSAWLYNWAQIGDWVYVHDNTGQTPTDPSLYTSGGA